MALTYPTHWKEPYQAKGIKYDKIKEIIDKINAIIDSPSSLDHGDLLGLGDDDHPQYATIQYVDDNSLQCDNLSTTTFVQKISASEAFRYDTADTGAQANQLGVTTTTTGTGAIYFFFSPPEWLRRWAIVNSKTITLTTITVNWDNTVSADDIAQIRIWWGDGFSATLTSLLNISPAWGNGSIGFRNDVANVSDQVYTEGDRFPMLLNTSQATSQSCRVKSFEVSWALS